MKQLQRSVVSPSGRPWQSWFTSCAQLQFPGTQHEKHL